MDANLTRIGVLLYRRADGTTVRELRHPDEVFNADSLASLGGAPVTDLHPIAEGGLVTPSNVKALQCGHVGESVKADGKFVSATVIVQDAALIAAVESGERRELSPGYTCRVDATPGTWKGEAYDAIQRDIVYNHLAVGPRGWGRSGSEVALKMDMGDGMVAYKPESPVGDFVRSKLSLIQKSEGHLAEALGVDLWLVQSFLDGSWSAFRKGDEPHTGIARSADFTPIAEFIGVDPKDLFALVPVAERGDGQPTVTVTPTQRKKTMEPVTIKIDGIEYEVSKSAAPHVEKALANRDVVVAAQTKRADEASAKADAEAARADVAVKERDDLKAKLDASESPERIAALVNARVSLEGTARGILGAEAKFDGKSERALKVDCIKHTDAKFNEDGKSDDYVAARFDAIVESGAAAQSRADGKDAAAIAALAAKAGVTPVDSEKARLDSIKVGQEAWKKPIGLAARV